MADNKLEQMLEKLVNNDRAGADELFHEFVIEKSRGIYEKMLESDLEDLEVDEAKDEEVDEATDEETNEATDEEVDESSDDEETNEATDEEVDEATDEEVDEASDEDVEENFMTPEADPMGGDAADDMMKDIEADADGEEGDEMGGDEEEIEDRVVDLEDALDDLKAEFEKMMAGDSDDEGDDDAADMDMDDEGDEDKEEAIEVPSELSVEDEAMPFESKAKTAGEQMREYVEKVAEPKGEDNKAKSPVASKNDMGGTASNIAAGGEGATGGSAMSSKEDNAGNVNVPGGKASKSMSANAKGHGAEKKGSGETGTNSKSTIGS